MIKIKLLSSADTGYFYVTKKNARTKTDKLSFKKYDPVARKHVEFKETKIKYAPPSADLDGKLLRPSDRAFFDPGAFCRMPRRVMAGSSRCHFDG